MNDIGDNNGFWDEIFLGVSIDFKDSLGRGENRALEVEYMIGLNYSVNEKI